MKTKNTCGFEMPPTAQRVSSVRPNRKERWVRVSFDDDELRWWKNHCDTASLQLPPPAADAAAQGRGTSNPLLWAPSNKTGERLPWINFAVGGEFYSPSESRNRARRNRNRNLSPQARLLSVRNAYHAILFLRDFGPLDRDDDQPQDRERDTFINFEKFFRRQSIYSAITRLWNAYPDPGRLRKTWTNILTSRPRSFSLRFEDGRAYPSDGDPVIWLDGKRGILRGLPNVSYDYEGNPIDGAQPYDWVAAASLKELQDLTLSLIVSQVEENAPNRVRWASRLGSEGRPEFAPEAERPSLWARIWEFFALDTQQGVSWRFCPHCGKVFYPPRKDRLFCTPRQQELHAKRAWWREHGQKKTRRRVHLAARAGRPAYP
jgi:hypothetical protein